MFKPNILKTHSFEYLHFCLLTKLNTRIVLKKFKRHKFEYPHILNTHIFEYPEKEYPQIQSPKHFEHPHVGIPINLEYSHIFGYPQKLRTSIQILL